ncbi:MAG: hypothetical protein KDI79_28785, partial [Anaerolineae bacterium]|nr:hypothetical protein [Anaerolineae bacterium]
RFWFCPRIRMFLPGEWFFWQKFGWSGALNRSFGKNSDGVVRQVLLSRQKNPRRLDHNQRQRRDLD